MANVVRGLVSKKKLRFKQDGFDLDLSYINDTIIAMGFPSDGAEGVYRNNMKDVQLFFKTFHDGHYRVYNLCSERHYDPKQFNWNCTRYPFNDHNPCELEMVQQVCLDIAEFHARDPKNVAAIHCKAGKGRTGMVIAAYLVYAGLAENAIHAMQIFASKRTANGKGVTIPSQQRYVQYFSYFYKNYCSIQKPFPFQTSQIVLKEIIMAPKADFDVGGGCDPYFIITKMNGDKIYHMKKEKQIKIKQWKYESEFRIKCNNIPLSGDIHIQFYDADAFSKDDKMFGCWLHTAFITSPTLVLHQHELDGAVKDKKHVHFPIGFTCTFIFDNVTTLPHMSELAHSCNNIDLESLLGKKIEEDDDDDDEDDNDEDEAESTMLASPTSLASDLSSPSNQYILSPSNNEDEFIPPPPPPEDDYIPPPPPPEH